MEVVNKIIKFNLKTKVEERKGLWAEELPKVLWAYRMTSRTSMGETPFSLGYGVETRIPVEIGVPFLRQEMYDQEENFKLQRYELDLLEEKCNLTALRVASYKRQSERYFNSKVKEKRFKEGDLVLRKVGINTKEVSAEVLGPHWEGPYLIKGVVQPETYKLKWLDDSTVPRNYNAEHFRPYYQ